MRTFEHDGEQWEIYRSGVDSGGPSAGRIPRIGRFGVWFKRQGEPQEDAIPGTVSTDDLDELSEDDLTQALREMISRSCTVSLAPGTLAPPLRSSH